MRKSWLKSLFLPVLLCVGLASPYPALAYTPGEICGDGVDNDSSGGDVLCGDSDLDRDSYTTDCDDTNRNIYSGISITSGCSAGNYRTCQANGTYTSCSALSGFTCHSGSGSTYWIDDSVSTCASSNAYATPSDWRCFSDTGMANYHAPVAGDCFVFKTTGTYNSTWSSGANHIFVNNKDGTSSDHIKLMAAPGTTWWENGLGNGVYIAATNTGGGGAVTFQDSDYIDVSGLEVVSVSGVQTVGIWFNAGGNVHAFNNAVHGIRGNQNNNLAGIRHNSGDVAEFDHNLVYNNYDSGNPTGENNANILVMDTNSYNVHDNVIYQPNGTDAAVGFKQKHHATGTNYVQRNVIYGLYSFGVWIGGSSNVTVSNNYLEGNNRANSGSSMGILSTGAGVVANGYSNIVFEYNTIKNGPAFEVRPEDDATQLAANFATFRYNNFVDDRGTSYPGDGTDGFIRIAHYLSDAVYAELITAASLVISNNCYYNSASTAIFETVFGDGAGNGTTYSTCAAMIAGSGTIAHTSSFCENPTYDADHRGTSTNCSNKGWKLLSGSTTTSTTSTSTSTTTTTAASTTTTTVVANNPGSLAARLQ